MKSSYNLIRKIITTAIVFLCIATLSFGQVDARQLLDGLLLNPEYKIEHEVIRQMRLENVSDAKILDHLENNYAKPRKKAAMERQKNGQYVHSSAEGKNPLPLSSCNGNDIGAELGNFGTWTGKTSTWNTNGNCAALPWTNTSLPLFNRITIVPGPAADPCATNPGFTIPLPSPTGGKFSVKLGNNQVNAESERITHQFIVQPSDTNFIYQYAVVFEDPTHLPSEQPFFDFVITAQNGDTIPCSFQHYTAGAGIPGFQTSTNPAGCGGNTFSTVYYKPWTTVGVNLGAYLNNLVTITCTTGDCSLCGHFGYTYLDFSCGTTTSSQFCVSANSVVVVAPLEPGATYSWIPTGQSTQSVTVNPQIIDTISVYVNPPSGCGYFVNFILEPTVITAALTYTTGCTSANFTGSTTITGGTISSYSWSFPGGSPSSSTSLIPPTITYPPGTYTVTFNVVSQAGCTAASTPVVITIQPAPVVNAGADVSACLGNTVQLNGSGTPSGGTYSWSPPANL
ncbi:MAG: hypothetical protein EPN85_08930, partial [Bacteroidetes bacterium]